MMDASRGRLAAIVSAALIAGAAVAGSISDAAAQAPQRQLVRFGTAGIGGDLPVEMMYVFKEWVDRPALWCARAPRSWRFSAIRSR